MNIITNHIESDGSAWTAVVEVEGVVYRAAYVANKLTCGLGPYKHNPRRPRWAEKSVKQWAEKQVAQLPADWMKLHQEMYA
jgi:hypothetical protein